MKLASFRTRDGDDFGLVVDEGVVPLGTSQTPTLRAALEAGAVQALVSAASGKTALPLDDLSFLPPITHADKIMCVGLNYRKHAHEAGMKLPEHPSIFCRFNNSQVGHGAPVVRPTASGQFDFEGELAVIIGRRARHVSRQDAMQFVAGYSCFAENSLRDFQRHGTQATAGKNFFASGGFGPWMVTSDAIPDPHDLMLETRLNGEVMQRESTGDMVFTVSELIEYMSTFTELVPGDVIVTGTPSGVGFTRKPPVFLVHGDVLEVEIDGIGVLRNAVVNE